MSRRSVLLEPAQNIPHDPVGLGTEFCDQPCFVLSGQLLRAPQGRFYDLDEIFEDLRREINAQAYPFSYSASAKGS